MNEIEKIEYTKHFIDQLAAKINPLNGEPIPETDLINNPRISRCFHYVSDILQQVIENGGVSREPSQICSKSHFGLTSEELNGITVSENPIGISDFAKKVQVITDRSDRKRISSVAITAWLEEEGYLVHYTRSDGKNAKRPTQKGESIGIFEEERTAQYGTYIAILYPASAQRFLIQHLNDISAFRKEKRAQSKAERTQNKDSASGKRHESHGDRLAEFRDRPWTQAHDELLMRLARRNDSIAEMARELGRTEEAILQRLEAVEAECPKQGEYK